MIKIKEYNDKTISLIITYPWEYIWEELTIGAFAQGISTMPHLCKYVPETEKRILEIYRAH